MKNYRKVNIDGVLLDRKQIEILFDKLADEQVIQNYSNANTYPIYELRNDYMKILETYNLLSKHLKLGIKIHSAGEWILDNFYIIEENYKFIESELSLKKYKSLNGIANGEYKGFSRIWILANILCSYTECNITEDYIKLALTTYQNKKMLSMEEISMFGIFLKIAEISHIRKICDKIIYSQKEKYKVESIIERIIDNKKLKDRKFTNNIDLKYVSRSELRYPFIEYMSYKLKKYGKIATNYQKVLEDEVLKTGLTISDIVQKEHFQIANLKMTLGNAIISIKNIGRINFNELLNEINGTEEILKQDPAGIYSIMDQDSKDLYRRKIEKIAKKYKISEIYISNKILELSQKYSKDNLKSHIGYYLFKDGYYELLEVLQIKHRKKLSYNKISRLYIALNFMLTLVFDFVFVIFSNLDSILGMVVEYLILYIPISEIVMRIMNYILLKIKKTTIIPKLDFEKEIPEEYSTICVIPTILSNEQKVEEMFKKLEIYYLANNQNNIYFALLGDCTESNIENLKIDEAIINKGYEISEKLNKKYNKSLFSFIYRKRVWNDGEQKYIGWERKRGLLYQFNKYLSGQIIDDFIASNFDEELKSKIKYVITLDSDTNLIFDSACKMIGAMAHILNRPVIQDNIVIDGYGIMQPKVGLDLEVESQSKFIEIYSRRKWC